MISILFVLMFGFQETPRFRLMSGAVDAIDGSSITVANAKVRRKFMTTPATTIVVDGARAEISEISLNDTATVTFDADSGEPKKIQVITEKAKASRKVVKKKAGTEDAAPVASGSKEMETEPEIAKEVRRKKRDEDREAKAIAEVRKQDEDFARQTEASYRVKDMGKGGRLRPVPHQIRFHRRQGEEGPRRSD
jgi:hypothetical protein